MFSTVMSMESLAWKPGWFPATWPDYDAAEGASDRRGADGAPDVVREAVRQAVLAASMSRGRRC